MFELREILGPYLQAQRARVWLLALLVFAGIGAYLVNPQIIRRFIDQAQTGQPLATLLGAAGLYFAVALVQQGIIVLTAWVGEQVSWQTTNALRADLVHHCLRLDMSFHKETTPGELIERIDGDVNALGLFLSQFFVQLLSNLLLMLGVVLLLWLEDWRFGLMVTLVLAVAAYYIQRLRPISTERWTRARAASAAFYGFIEERLGGREDIGPNGAAAFTLRKMQRRLRDVFLAERSAELVSAALGATPNLSFGLAMAAAYWLGGTLFAGGAVTIGTIYLVFSYIDLINDRTWRLIDEIQYLQRSQASIGRIRALLNIDSRLEDNGTSSLPAGSLDLRFASVTFQYEDDDSPTLRDIAFSLPAGRVLGLLGRTGSGKSTLIGLLFRLYDATEGRVLLGGQDVRDVPLAVLRGRIGMVTQQVQLFRASLRDNLTLFDESVPDEKLLAALDALGLQHWYQSLPDGLDTMLQAGGSGLSAGQAQLIAFARVFLRDPDLVILDEASSRLDPATEQLLEQAVGRLLEGRTAVIIAHRLATVERADQILVLEEGEILEQGDRIALATDPSSAYAQLRRAGAAVADWELLDG
jgi:ABC-type multidrug transport system fused ATPase/permease subunit